MLPSLSSVALDSRPRSGHFSPGTSQLRIASRHRPVSGRERKQPLADYSILPTKIESETAGP